MRLILVDSRSDAVCGDVPGVEAARDTASQSDKLESLCKAAARSVDESRGAPQAIYDFTCFREASDKTSGYFVFRANEQGVNSLRGCAPSLSDVFTRCFYVGFVYRRPE